MQKILHLKSTYKDNDDSFITSSSNIQAYNAVNNLKNNRILVIGSPKSGKTLLAKLWKKDAGAIFFKNITDLNYNERIIVDNIENFHDDILINIINFSQENSLSLLLTCSKYPNFNLKDLNSRMKSTYKVWLKEPDEKMVKLLIAKFFKQRQVLISQEIIHFMYQMIERKYSSINTIVNTIDKQSIIKKRKITLQFVQEILHTLYIKN